MNITRVVIMVQCSVAAAEKRTFRSDTNYENYPGAGGEVGLKLYLNKKEKDCYNILWGSIGAESIMYVLQKPAFQFPGDYVYFMRVGSSPTAIWVRAESPFKTIQQLVEEGKKRTITLSTSRLPHPASIGALALADAIGAKFNLIPYGGGNPSSVAVMTGEVDACASPVGLATMLGDRTRVLVIMADKNKSPNITNNAPCVNDVFGTKIPSLSLDSGLGIHTEAIKKYPERFKKIVETAKKVFDDPDYKAAQEKTGISWDTIEYGDQEIAMKYAKNMMDLTNRYRDLLSAKKKKK